MKLNKDNCYSYYLNDYDGERTCSLKAETWRDDFPKARVIEVPKVWREDGKQYKVTRISIGGGPGTPLDGIPFIVKAPRGCDVSCVYCERIEYYD